jgi:hypothetical protein
VACPREHYLPSSLQQRLALCRVARAGEDSSTDPYGDGDHADHHNAAYYTYEAQLSYATPHVLQGFRAYPIFLAYAAHDSHTCQTAVACRQDRKFWPWMFRSYEASGPPAPTVGTAQTGLNGPAG